MSDTVWITHSGTGGVAEVPADALPMYRQSGWDVLPKADRDARDQAAADEIAAAEADMVTKARAAREQGPPQPPPEPDAVVAAVEEEPSSDAKTGRQTKKGNA